MSVREYLRTATRRVRALPQNRTRVGYIGGATGNLGDASMAAAATHLLPGCTVLPYVYDAVERRLGYVGLSGRPYFRAVVLGGGTLINPYGYAVTRRAAQQKIPLFAVGTGAGSGGFSQPPEADLAPWTPLLQSFTRIGVRGPRSLRLLQEAGATRCEIVGDLALALARPQARRARHHPRTFGINAITPHGHAAFGQQLLTDLGTIAGHLIREGWRPVAFAMSPTDGDAIGHVLREAGCSNGDILHPTTADDLLDHLTGCTTVISMRLHGSVLSACAGVPPVIVAYLDKCRDFAESMELSDLVVGIDDLTPSRVIDRVRDITRQGQPLRENILARARAWQTRLRTCFADIRATFAGT